MRQRGSWPLCSCRRHLGPAVLFGPAAISVSDLPSHINTTSRPSWLTTSAAPTTAERKVTENTRGRESSQTQQSLLKIDETHLQRPAKDVSGDPPRGFTLSLWGNFGGCFIKNSLRGVGFFFNSQNFTLSLRDQTHEPSRSSGG